MVKGEPRSLKIANGSGRQAVIFELKDLDFLYNDKRLVVTLQQLFQLTITKEAMPTAIQKADIIRKIQITMYF